MFAYWRGVRPTMMKCLSRFLAVTLAVVPWPAWSQAGAFRAPDSLVLRDGRTVSGLIVRNTVSSVVLQERFGENTYPKSEIVRIRDGADAGMEFTDALRRGQLPAWRVIANDLRTHDDIKRLIEIPATVIDNGVFQNVPYKSFRVNGDVELNIYGDPENPAGIEIGIYGPRSRSARLQRTLRNYLGGFLTTREEVAAMFSLPLTGGLAHADTMSIEITPPGAPDAYGAWWVSIFNKKRLADARLDEAEYARLTRPMGDVLDRRGRVLPNAWTDAEMELSERADEEDDVILRGFYRDANGDFRLVTAGKTTVTPVR